MPVRINLPGQALTRGNRLSQLLVGGDPQRMNTGSVTGGLASALTRGLQGYMAGKDRSTLR